MFCRASVCLCLLVSASNLSAALGAPQSIWDWPLQDNTRAEDSTEYFETLTDTAPMPEIADGVNDQSRMFPLSTTSVRPNRPIIQTIASRERADSIGNEIKSLVNRIRDNQSAMIISHPFRDRVHEYMSVFKSKTPKVIKKLFRESCDCDNERYVAPCPEKCLYSCYDQFERSSINDCRHRETLNFCSCSETSSTTCGDNMENCITFDNTDTDDNCSKHIPDEAIITESFDIWINLIVEPVRKSLRSIESKLNLHRAMSATARQFQDWIRRSCAEKSDFCPENRGLTENVNFPAMGKNITSELVDLQNRIELAATKIYDLQEKAIGQIVNSTQKYVCCLDTNNLSIDGYKCEK